MFVGENATGGNKRGESKHNDVDDKNESFGLGIFREGGTSAEEDCSNDHNVGRREAGFARIIGTDQRIWFDNTGEDLIKDKIYDYHEGDWKNHPKKLFVDLLERFARNPLGEPKDGKEP